MSGPEANISLAIDAMGSDLGPAEIVAGVKLALNGPARNQTHLCLVGEPEVLRERMAEHGLTHDERVSVYPASEVITMEDKPVTALKRKRDASMVRAIELVKDGKARAIISCGNTGALMAGGTLKLRPLEGVDRPAIGSIMPGKERHFVMIDAGANPESRPEHLLHNAVLGRDYAQIVLKIDQPKVGLLTIGTEEGKGTERISRTHRLLKMAADEGLITYSGLIEGFQLFDNHVDVVVCDGFTGNVVLKACEGLFKFMSHVLREEMTANPIRSLGAALCKGAFLDLRERMSPEAFGGAPLLGLRGNILKAHGSANRHAIVSAIRIARELARHELVRQSREDIARVNRCLQSTSAITPATAS